MKRILSIFILLVFVGCSGGEKKYYDKHGLVVFTDPDTGVQYVHPVRGHGLCLRVDKNGNPIIKKDIEK